MTPLNYAANAVRDLRRYSTQPHCRDVDKVIALLTEIQKAENFQLPDGGRLFDDGLKGLRDRKARLPFPLITVQYYVSTEAQIEAHRRWNNLTVVCNKRLVLAQEIDDEQKLESMAVRFGVDNLSEGAIVVSVLGVYNQRWVPNPISWLMPMLWEEGGKDAIPVSLPGENKGSTGVKLIGWPLVRLPNLYDVSKEDAAKQGIDEQEFVRMGVMDIRDEVSAVMSLAEAAACANVKVDYLQTADEAVNKKRIKAGKLPLYETRILTVEVPTISSRVPDLGRSHASPRQHLRRGHIRQYQSGLQIWINSMVVGDSRKGRVDKKYSFECA